MFMWKELDELSELCKKFIGGLLYCKLHGKIRPFKRRNFFFTMSFSSTIGRLMAVLNFFHFTIFNGLLLN